jgi:hypothetical protein
VVTDVRLGDDPLAAGRPDGGGDLVPALRRPVDEGDPAPEPPEGDGRSRADSAQAAGDENDGADRLRL